jgi:hypothetical protein
MKKLFPCALLLFACPCSWAQRTVVSGTIADPGGVPYSGASLTVTLSLPTGALGAYLNGAQIAGTVGPVQLDATGSFLVQLADNTQIKCANAIGQIVACAPQTQWTFAITLSPGVLPPEGLGPKTCSTTLTITGASQTVTSSFSCPAIVRTSNGIGAFVYNPADTSGIVCPAFDSCATISSNSSTVQSGIGVAVTSPVSNVVMESSLAAIFDSTQNNFGNNVNVFSANQTALSPTNIGMEAIQLVGGTTTGGNCFLAGAGSPPCGIGFYTLIGDTSSTVSTANGQDAVGFEAQMELARISPIHPGNFAGFAMVTPANCSGTILGSRPCGVAQESAVNMWGLEIQDLQGRGTTSAIGVHIEPQTNPAAGNFAIKVEAGGGPSSFDGTATAVNCQLGGAAGTTSPAACTTATAGMIAIPASQTSYTVNSTKVTANSEIFVQQMTDNSGLPSAPACNAGATNPIQSARVAGTSFTFTLTSVAAVTCVKFWILN